MPRQSNRRPRPAPLLEALESRLLLSTVVGIGTGKATASEIRPDSTGTGRFALTRSGPLTAPLDVTISISGTAANTSDYATLATTVHFDIGKSTATVNIIPISDSLAEGTETVILTLVPDAAYTINPNRAAATVRINDAASTIGVTASKSNASEANGATTGAGRYTIRRSGGDLSLPLTVNFGLAGVAIEGTDYTSLPSHAVTFDPGKSSVVVTINPLPDVLLEPTESAVLTLTADPSCFLNATKSAATVNIANTRLAPDDIVGGGITANITSGSAPFASTGSLRILFSASDDRYLLVGGPGVTSSTGTFTYLLIAPAIAQITMVDSVLGTIVATLTFTSPTNATFVIIGVGIQSGSLTYRSPSANNFAPDSLAGRTGTGIISSATSTLPNNGSFRIALAQDTTHYVITGSPGGGNSSGNYSYEKFAAYIGLIAFTDAVSGPGWIVIIFSNTTNASFTYSLNSGASQRGNFFLDLEPFQTFAPATLGGHSSIQASITTGIPPLAFTGSFHITTSVGSYTLIGGPGIPSGTGSFNYEQLNPVTALLTLADGAGPQWIVLSFTNTGHANYVRVDGNTGAWQWGIMNFS